MHLPKHPCSQHHCGREHRIPDANQHYHCCAVMRYNPSFRSVSSASCRDGCSSTLPWPGETPVVQMTLKHAPRITGVCNGSISLKNSGPARNSTERRARWRKFHYRIAQNALQSWHQAADGRETFFGDEPWATPKALPESFSTKSVESRHSERQ